MNDTLQQLFDRKSVRVFTDEPISAADKRLVLQAALQAPTAGNMTLYTILDVTDTALKEKLSITCDHQPFIATAPMVLVFCADYKRWYDLFCAHETQVRRPAEGDLLLATADAIIAAQNAVVAAHSLGLGSCYIGDIIENFETHKELLGLPEYVVPACMVVFGHPTAQQLQRPKPPRFTVEDIVHENGYRKEGVDMEQMLSKRQALADLPAWIRAFCKRKWNSDFSVEMSRSAAALITNWCKGEKENEK